MTEPTAPQSGNAEPAAESHRCGQCGAFTDLRMGDAWICESCYVTCGSCCAERQREDDE
jgi:hypothetical protein